MDWDICHQQFSIHPMAAMEIPCHCWMDKNDKSYCGWLRNPNHQLVDGKHPIIYRVSAIRLVVQDFATIHCINGWFGHHITCHARQPDVMDAIKKRRCRGHGTEFCRGKKVDLYYQWKFQDPKMEVLYRIRQFFVGIFPYIGLKNRPYMVGTSNQSVPEMAIDLM